MITCPFTVGQRVTIDNGREIFKITTVAKIDLRKITLADGRMWRPDGYKPYGNKDSWYTGPHVRPWKDGDEARLQAAQDYSAIRVFDGWRSLTAEQLAQVAAIVRAAKKGTTEVSD